MWAHKVFNLTRFSSWILAYTIAWTQDIWLLFKFWSTWYWFFYKKHDQYLLKYHQLWFIMCTIASFCPHFHWSFSMHVQGSVILWSVMHINRCMLVNFVLFDFSGILVVVPALWRLQRGWQIIEWWDIPAVTRRKIYVHIYRESPWSTNWIPLWTCS